MGMRISGFGGGLRRSTLMTVVFSLLVGVAPSHAAESKDHDQAPSDVILPGGEIFDVPSALATLEVSSTLLRVGIASAGSVGPQVDPATSQFAKSADVTDGLVSDTRFEVAHASQFAEFAAIAAADGSVRLIVTLRMLWAPVSLLSSEVQDAQTETIATRQDALLSSLVGTDHRVVHRYRFIPSMALELGEDGVRALEASGKAARLQQDVASPVTLGDSVPLINADDAWALGFEGTGQVVAILDTGVEGTHAFLAGKVVEEACYSGGSDCPNGLTTETGPGAGVNCTYTASCDHGTHVAGIAAGLAPPGSSGVARDADIMAVQVFSRFDGSICLPSPSPCTLSFVSDQLAGLERVFARRTAHSFSSVNMSIGGGQSFSACDTDSRKPAIDNLLTASIPTVISSGNSGWVDSVGAPGCISTAVTVASSTKTDLRSSFSNTAPFVDLIAPGSLITSSVPGGAFGVKSGTSMAAPHVAGAWAIVKEAFPGASVADVLQAFKDTGTAIQVRTSPLEFLPRIDVLAALGHFGANQAPTVSASADPTVTLPDSANLSGTVNDDGLPNPPNTVTTTWSKVSGLGTVTFGNSSLVNTTASFSTDGAYVLRLTADDSVLQTSDDVIVIVSPMANTFIDDDGHIFEYAIEWLAAERITLGCNPPSNDKYCPDDFVTRGQMAVFLVRAMGYKDNGGGDLFIDDDGFFYENAADRLFTAEVTKGCNPPINDKYCGEDFVTRGQMAAFLVRAMGYTDNGGGNLFIDDDGHLFESDIDKLGAAKVTLGCNPPVNDKFCPDDLVTRGQMAAFLKRALT